MKKEIRLQLVHLSIVLTLMIVLGIWQHEFVISAVTSNVMLNMTILGTFAFGTFLIYYNVASLGNEIKAFEALREKYSDIRNTSYNQHDDNNQFYYRCEKPAIVFSRPKLLGQAYQIISYELAKQRDLKLTTETMKTLVDSLETQIYDQKALVQYISGILVFFGLIGTFIGLMVTLGSVGDIIGSLDLSKEDTAGTISKLMTDLKLPLEGMATGFSSSLFGLITSLTISLMAQFSERSALILKKYFEEWLAGAAQITVENEGVSTSTIDKNALGMEAQHLRLMFRVARHIMASNKSLSKSQQDMHLAIAEMHKQNIDNTHLTKILIKSVQHLSEHQQEVTAGLSYVHENLEQQGIATHHWHQKNSEHLQTVNCNMLDMMQAQKALAPRVEETHQNLNKYYEVLTSLKTDEGKIRQTIMDLDSSHQDLSVVIEKILLEMRHFSTTETLEDHDTQNIMNQLDQLLSVSQLSLEDTQRLKKLSALYEQQAQPLDDLIDIIANAFQTERGDDKSLNQKTDGQRDVFKDDQEDFQSTDTEYKTLKNTNSK